MLTDSEKAPSDHKSDRVHPLQIVQELRNAIDDDVTVTCDIGSHAIWMSRYFRAYEPLKLLISNGMQTLGVALPWAIAATLVNPGEKSYPFQETEDSCSLQWNWKRQSA